jgi:hypothetical protein
MPEAILRFGYCIVNALNLYVITLDFSQRIL